jgi:indole-3-glycerol phosphate synthase
MTRRSLTEVLSSDELALVVEPRRMDHGNLAAAARDCQDAGASALCLSTEAGWVLADIELARAACSLPVIARGGVADPGRLAALAAVEVDAIMSDAGSLGDGVLDAARAAGIEVVLTVHDEDELERALATDADVLAIDNRDASGRVDTERTFDLLAAVPVGWPVVSESIGSLDEVARLHRAGVDALLLDEGHLDTGLASALAAYAEAARRPLD